MMTSLRSLICASSPTGADLAPGRLVSFPARNIADSQSNRWRGLMSERLTVGDTAPDFTLQDADGNEVALKDLRGKNVIVYFYPAAMTPGCTKQACDFRDSLDSLQAAGYAVLGISPDKPAKLAKFRERDAVTFPLLSDPDKEVLTAYGAFGEKTMYGKKVTGVIRSTFVVDPDGKIAVAQYNVKATGHVAKLRRDLGL
jgi:peroxiredoxin Q/BCP